MKIRTFSHGVGNKWEINFIGKWFNLRIARCQLALWRGNGQQIFNFNLGYDKNGSTTTQKLTP